MFITGTDEHGLKMVQTARAAGRDTHEFATEMSAYFKEMGQKLNISYDRFLRTSDDVHHEASKAIWKAMEASGDLYLDRYEGWYSVRDEAFYDESELVAGEVGEKLSPQGTPVEWTAEETWFFRLSNYQDKLLNLYRDRPDFILPESRRNEVIRFVEGGLKDLSVSRTSFDWGVPVPGSPATSRPTSASACIRPFRASASSTNEPARSPNSVSPSGCSSIRSEKASQATIG
jgi:methionyl-tRNA synthetase